MKSNEFTIDYHLRSTWLAVQKMFNEQAAQFNSTMVMGFTLLSIDPKSGTPSTSLGPKMGIEPTSLSRTLKNLEERGLIARKPNPEDGRSVLIILTDEGLKMRDVSKQVVLKFNEAINEKITAEEMSIFLKVIQKVNSITSDKKLFNKNKEPQF
ncbi:MarR family winged helix-turn-helix transcriptional regulator [Moheibacter sediminis]|uniref:DNA-binding transcriptional regulator, MarR family n=1 Tax=Moheibacter sediminis TaxID=1434700 RepID=A0A1W2CFB3_9FLAO|nr:MarR family transcriptional regulator [Moheibacter sediminis]SMC83903.1 DNA-binding transcriptional regulator, MarR family [Moheibacter sediminis]